VINPYNREPLEAGIIKRIITLYNLTILLYPSFKSENEIYTSAPNPQTSYRNMSAANRAAAYTRLRQNMNANTLNGPLNREQPGPLNREQPGPLNREQPGPLNREQLGPFTATPTTEQNQNIPRPRPRPRPILSIESTQSPQLMEQYARISDIRTRSLESRINNLFVEIDQLGNYTQSEWFNNLGMNEYVRLYRSLYEIWHYRGQLSRQVRINICPYYGVFEGALPLINHSERTTMRPDEIKMACLIVFENMVYSGIDDDHRKLGALHALSALTLVSAGARQAMPWLYESVAY
jgi:hypothetical protein